jgi:hypothetical protein
MTDLIDDEEIYNLDTTIAAFVLPRLKAYRERYATKGHPSELTNEQWCAIIDKMIAAFEAHSGRRATPDDLEAAQEGLHLFATYFGHLWD